MQACQINWHIIQGWIQVSRAILRDDGDCQELEVVKTVVHNPDL